MALIYFAVSRNLDVGLTLLGIVALPRDRDCF